MHLLVRETHGLDEGEAAVDLGQSPGDVVFLSFSDSDLRAMRAASPAPLEGEGRGEGCDAVSPSSFSPPTRISLRLANLVRLRHPMSVDVYVEDVIAHSRCVVIRLLGGLDYWRYGAEEVAAICARNEIPLAIVPGDGRADPRLAELSTMRPDLLARMDALLAQGGPANMRAALALASHAAGLAPAPTSEAAEMPLFGEHPLELAGGSLAVIVFYRAYLLAADMAPIEALAAALHAQGLGVRALYVASLKEPGCAAFVADTLRAWRPAVVLNATGFSATMLDDG